MNSIKWEDGTVCFANGVQHIASGFLDDDLLAHCLTFDDFQLNEIRQGDYISASELYTEQKYNDAVEVFELFGFETLYDYEEFTADSESHYNTVIAHYGYQIDLCDASFGDCHRKITYSQLMAIGKLKRAMIERDKERRLVEAGVIHGDLLKEGTMTYPDDFLPKDEVVNLGGVDVNVKWDLNNPKCQAGRVVNVDDFGNLPERDAETVCGKPKADFEKAIDKVKSLQQDFSSEQATLDCKDLDINVVFTGEGVYILDCINSVEYQLESVDEYNKVVSAIRLLQSKER